MPLTKEQTEQFNQSPFPQAARLELPNVSNPPIFHGKEALVRQAVTGEGSLVAFKWYASLSGRPISDLAAYAADINRDEQILWTTGLLQIQVPNTDFFISGYTAQPELFAIQPWARGRLLKKLGFKEIFTNPNLCRSLVRLFRDCDLAYRQTGRFPDLVSGDTANLFGYKVEDPIKLIWPLKSSNIVIEDDEAVLLDARFLNVRSPSPKFQVARFHHYMTLLIAGFLERLHN